MLFRDGEYTCAHCGASLEIPAGADPQMMIRAASGKRNVRVLTFMGVEVHRCDVVGLNRRLPDRSGMQHVPKAASLASRGGLSES